MRVVQGGAMEMNALTFHEPHPSTIQYIGERIGQIGNYLSDAGRNFMSSVRTHFDDFASSEALRRARAAVRMAGKLFQRDEVQPLTSLDQFQQAPPVMQRFVMANPFVRQMYFDQRIDGYSNSYVDVEPGAIGNNHYDYRRVNDAVITDLPDNDWKVTWHFDELKEGDRHLRLDEKHDILDAWDFIQGLIKEGKEDPTSPFGSML